MEAGGQLLIKFIFKELNQNFGLNIIGRLHLMPILIVRGGVSFYFGEDAYINKSSAYYVRAVPGKKYQPFDHFIINDYNTLTDINSGLMWSQEVYSSTMITYFFLTLLRRRHIRVI